MFILWLCLGNAQKLRMFARSLVSSVVAKKIHRYQETQSRYQSGRWSQYDSRVRIRCPPPPCQFQRSLGVGWGVELRATPLSVTVSDWPQSLICDLWPLTSDGEAVNAVRSEELRAEWSTLFRGFGPGLGQSHTTLPPPHSQWLAWSVNLIFGLSGCLTSGIPVAHAVGRMFIRELFWLKKSHQCTVCKHRWRGWYGTCVCRLVCVFLRRCVKVRGSSLDRETADSRTTPAKRFHLWLQCRLREVSEMKTR